jgi:hypothetical protein
LKDYPWPVFFKPNLMLTGNLPFSKWEVIFKDPTMTAAAIDRLIHHTEEIIVAEGKLQLTFVTAAVFCATVR